MWKDEGVIGYKESKFSIESIQFQFNNILTFSIDLIEFSIQQLNYHKKIHTYEHVLYNKFFSLNS